MSTDLHLVCLSHDPYIESDELTNHVNNDIITDIAGLVLRRDDIIKFIEDFEMEFTDPMTRRVTWFMRYHKKCNYALKTEYNEWIDIGMGLPLGVKLYETNIPAAFKKVVVSKDIVRSEVVNYIDAIRKRDSEVTPQFFEAKDDVWDTYLQAAHDRRYLLNLLEDVSG